MDHELVHAGPRLWVWRRDPSLWVTVLWGAPTEGDMRDMAALHDRAFQRDDPFESLVDLGGVTAVDPVAYEHLAAFARRRRDGFERLIRKQALVRPAGMIGALVTGFFEAEGFAMPVRAFEDRARALAWLRPDEGDALATEADARLAAVRAVSPALAALRAQLADTHGRAIAIGACASALGVSSRTLQRQLRDAGTSFRTEITSARIDAAKRLLQTPETKLAAIALEVGFATSQAFAAAFRADTGVTPSAWRVTRLRAASRVASRQLGERRPAATAKAPPSMRPAVLVRR